MHSNTDTERRSHRRGHALKRDRRPFTSSDVTAPTEPAEDYAERIGANTRPSWYPGETDHEYAQRILREHGCI